MKLLKDLSEFIKMSGHTASEKLDSAVSYVIGLCGIMLSGLVDNATAITVVGGCIIVIVRLIHDLIKLVRYVKSNKV